LITIYYFLFIYFCYTYKLMW